MLTLHSVNEGLKICGEAGINAGIDELKQFSLKRSAGAKK